MSNVVFMIVKHGYHFLLALTSFMQIAIVIRTLRIAVRCSLWNIYIDVVIMIIMDFCLQLDAMPHIAD